MATDRYHITYVDENGKEHEEYIRGDGLSNARRNFREKHPDCNLLSIEGDSRRNN